jgi:impB/mucB/samB family
MIPYEFEQKSRCFRLGQSSISIDRYKHLSLQFYKALMSYADGMQAVSVDEALIDVSSTVESPRRYAAAVNRDATQLLGFA